MEKTEILIQHIQESNLSDSDKEMLTSILKEDNIDYTKFINTFLTICKVGKDYLKLFDIDIGDLF
jgi:hypothetical protein